MKMGYVTVGELRDRLRNLPFDLPVRIYVHDRHDPEFPPSEGYALSAGLGTSKESFDLVADDDAWDLVEHNTDVEDDDGS